MRARLKRPFHLALVIALLFVFVLPGSVAASDTEARAAAPSLFFAVLMGENEIPPADLDGVGLAFVLVNTTTNVVCWNIIVRNIVLPATLAHIHVGAAGQSGSPVVDLLPAPDATGMSRGCIMDPDADAVAANPSGYYVNVHTTDFPSGAIRGQLRAA